MSRLTVADVLFLLEQVDLPADLKRTITALPVPVKNRLTVEEIDFLRDLVGERLQEVGFNAEYDPTESGRHLELLVDKLFTS